eukprot:8516789-Pyramimonas_sp.AAC.2
MAGALLQTPHAPVGLRVPLDRIGGSDPRPRAPADTAAAERAAAHLGQVREEVDSWPERVNSWLEWATTCVLV